MKYPLSSFKRRTAKRALALLAVALLVRTLPAAETAPDDPLSHLTIYIVPHSHVDIGFTELQTDIEDKQVENLLAGIAAARRTASYPAGARYVYNLEGLWPADLLLRRLDATQRADFLTAVRQGHVALNGMFTNTLTGLCRPEELVRLFRFATQLRATTGAPLDTAMVSDLPAVTWGVVPALAQAGIRYLSIAPNHRARLGGMHEQWDDKPFWWIGPAARDRVLVWLPTWGYGYANSVRQLSEKGVRQYVEDLRRIGYAYDVSYIRWAGLGDNAAPDPSICEFVKEWNAAHAWPRLVIAPARDAFCALEKKYGAQLPEVRGDMTPYWEDGAGSTAHETAMSRANSDRLAQAEALWAMLAPATFPARDFDEAMRLVLLYDEHSWGSSVSVSAPTSKESLAQWSIKQSYAGAADFQTRDLLSRALALARTGQPAGAVDVFNTNSWPRSDTVVLSKHLATGGNSVKDENGQPVPAQRLTNGELVFWAREVPAFGRRRYTISKEAAPAGAKVTIGETSLDNGLVSVALDPQTGGIVALRAQGRPENLVDTESGGSLNEYLYFIGADPGKAASNGPVTIRVKEKGPLVASLLVESEAPGCFALKREITLVAGRDYVEIANLIDRQRLNAKNYFHVVEGKESVNLAFPFKVPDGQVRLEVPFGVVRPDLDQIPGANKNWFSIDRWADVSNADFGVTWVSLDAPLVEVGGLTANVIVATGNQVEWRKTVGPTQKIYAWLMNNQWNVNYTAYQEGPTTFRFLLRPHRGYDAAAASRLAIGASQPLLAVRASGAQPPPASRLTLDSHDVIVTGMKPSDDGRAIIARLWNATGQTIRARLQWSAPLPRLVSLSDTSELPLSPIDGAVDLPAWGVVALRADLP